MQHTKRCGVRQWCRHLTILTIGKISGAILVCARLLGPSRVPARPRGLAASAPAPPRGAPDRVGGPASHLSRSGLWNGLWNSNAESVRDGCFLRVFAQVRQIPYPPYCRYRPDLACFRVVPCVRSDAASDYCARQSVKSDAVDFPLDFWRLSAITCAGTFTCSRLGRVCSGFGNMAALARAAFLARTLAMQD